MAFARTLDFPRRGAIGPADRRDRAYFDRRRGRAVIVGAAAVALSAHLGAGVPVAAAVAALADAAVAASGARGRGDFARVRRRAESAADAGRAPAVLLHH